MTSRLKSAAGAVLSGASRMEMRSETRKNWRESLCMKYLHVSYLKHLYTPDLRVSMSSLDRIIRIFQDVQDLRFEMDLVSVAAAHIDPHALARLSFVSTGKKCRKSSGASGLRDNSH